MIIHAFFIRGIAHSSYIIGGDKACAVVDPRRDVDVYLEAAREAGLKITHILETHLHADFLSGHVELARRTGARIYAPRSARCRFDHVPLAEGDAFSLEEMRFSVLETPGHTPEHISYVVADRARGRDPVAVFCGDTLFVGDAGRPDLFPGMADRLASKLYDSLFGKLLELPDHCEVYPAHGAGSLCGKAIGDKRSSTIGYERKYNPVLQVRERKAFIRGLTTNMPPAPDHFGRCSELNRRGPAPVGDVPPLAELAPKEFARRIAAANAIVVDARPYDAFGGQHVPGSYGLDLAGNFATFAGWVIPPRSEIYVVADDRARAEEAAVWLRRVGLDRIRGTLAGGLVSWVKAGLPTARVGQISVPDFHRMCRERKCAQFVDIRSPGEFAGGAIKGAVNIPAPNLRTKYKGLRKDRPVVLICSTGNRSSLAASLLLMRGFRDVGHVAGGMTGYAAAGFKI
ncbi:MAG: MBL fold metallo-hydrolase [Candidatus Aminicenantes bacterium]|nr:MBL fold metallo-hydrolase [Candidatus Aminicenantes bacterium]